MGGNYISHLMPVSIEMKQHQCSSIRCMSTHFKDRHLTKRSEALFLPRGPFFDFAGALQVERELSIKQAAR